jgi:hypothetical protein
MSAEHVRAPDDKESKQQSAVKVPHPPFWRKCMIVLATSWITLSACFSSTVFFSVVKEVSDDFNASPSTINLANSGVLLTLDMSTLIWGPVEIVRSPTHLGKSLIVYRSSLDGVSRTTGVSVS